MRMILLAICTMPLCIVALTVPAHARDFACRNTAAEISCADGVCSVTTDGFTPGAVSRSGHTLEICAYSGCASGPVLVRRTRGNIDLLYATVRWRGTGQPSALSVIFDRETNSAMVNWGGFSNAMGCKKTD